MYSTLNMVHNANCEIPDWAKGTSSIANNKKNRTARKGARHLGERTDPKDSGLKEGGEGLGNRKALINESRDLFQWVGEEASEKR